MLATPSASLSRLRAREVSIGFWGSLQETSSTPTNVAASEVCMRKDRFTLIATILPAIFALTSPIRRRRDRLVLAIQGAPVR